MSGECRKGGVCPPAQSAKLKIIYGLKVSKIADLDVFSKVTRIVYMVGGYPRGGGGGGGGAASFQGGQMPPCLP